MVLDVHVNDGNGSVQFDIGNCNIDVLADPRAVRGFPTLREADADHSSRAARLGCDVPFSWGYPTAIAYVFSNFYSNFWLIFGKL